jgi:hypothetical protein
MIDNLVISSIKKVKSNKSIKKESINNKQNKQKSNTEQQFKPQLPNKQRQADGNVEAKTQIKISLSLSK